MNLLERAKKIANGLRILWDWVGDGQEVVEQEHAQKRTNICLTCHCNEEGSTLTKAAAWAIKEQTELKRDLQLTVQGETRLQTCSVCTCWLPLKIWLPIGKIRKEQLPEERDKWPEWCWIKNEP